MTTIQDKLASLLRMTEANGCTEDEAETAMRLAAGIAAKHGIDLNDCRPVGSAKIKITKKTEYKEMPFHQAFCARAAAALHGVECVLYDEGKHGFQFVGREDNIELATQTMFWLFRQIEEIYKQHLPKGLSKTERAEFRRTFKPACARRVYQRAYDIVRKMQQDDVFAQAATGSNALVVQGYFATLADEINEYYNEKLKPTPEQVERARKHAEQDRIWREANPEAAKRYDVERAREDKKWAKRKGPRARTMPTGSGTDAGYTAGDRVKLRKDVN